MKIAVFILMMLFAVSSFAKPSANQDNIIKSIDDLKIINGKLLDMDDESGINDLLEQKVGALNRLMANLKLAVTKRLPAIVFNKDLTYLESRVKVNAEKGNHQAALRDQIKIETYAVNQAIRTYLASLIDASKKYQSIESVISFSQDLLGKSVIAEKKLILPETDNEGRIYQELKKNHQTYLQVSNSYQDILMYVINNPRKIVSTHWFQEFSLLSVISYLNHFDFIQPVNYKMAPFNIDVGGVVLSIVIFFLVYFSHPFIFKFTSWCVESFIINKGEEQEELIYHEIRRPARALLIFFALNLGAYAFFYKTDYRTSLEGISFVIYSLIIAWLLFKIVDSIILVQVQKLSSSNKELRVELFNLGVQSIKAIIIIIVLAFGLNHFGISLTAIMSTLGIGGLAFALAAKDTLSNLFGGITILFDNIFKMGEWVKIGDVEGTVAEIGLRSTTIRTFENALIVIPNSLVSISSVMNWNRRAVGRRIKMFIGVTYESDFDDLRRALEDIRIMLREHPDIANPKYKHNYRRKKENLKFLSHEDTHGIKSTQLVFMDRYSDFSIDILIYCFSRTVNWEEWLTVKEDVMFKVADILKKNNLEFAYPTQVRIHRSEKNDKINQIHSMEDSELR